MVEGDDFFERGYTMLSKNMPSDPVKEIQILKNYSDNPLIGAIENNRSIALNLKLDEEYKRIWFGNVYSGYGLEKFHEYKGNFMNFGRRNKYYAVISGNNSGTELNQDMGNIVQKLSFNELHIISNEEKVNEIIKLPIPNISLRKEMLNFNNSKLTSLNGIFNPNERLKLRALFFIKC